MRIRAALTSLILLLFVALGAAADADWEPHGIVPTRALTADVLAAVRRAAGTGALRYGRRRERWTYRVGTRRIAVSVAVRDDDFRTSLELDGLTYTAGRSGGVRWRADGNGIAHGVEADLQSDPADRAPQAIFALDPASCTLAGETRDPAPAWVIAVHRDGDKAAFLYVDKSSGTIVREVMRDGRQVITTTFDRFEPLGDGVRTRHWHIDDGDAADTTDVTVESIEPAAVDAADIARPERLVFRAASTLTQDIDAAFHDGRVWVAADIDGSRRNLILDTGTTSITIDPSIAARYGGAALGHAALPNVRIGPLVLDRVSALTVPFDDSGIVGLDFFFGHVIEIDYPRKRVRVLGPDDAKSVFDDPETTVIHANVDQGLPLVTAAFGAANGATFAIDTGSPRLYVMRPFVSRFAAEIAAHWTAVGRPFIERYLEGGIELQAYRVAQFRFANAATNDLLVGAQIPTRRTDDLDIPFDGIIGTDILQHFDLFFDYDHGRMAVRD